MRLADFIEANSSRIMGVGMSIDRKLCDLCEELADEVELLKAALPESEISLHCEGAVQGRFDASRIREAVHNLVANAIKYGDRDRRSRSRSRASRSRSPWRSPTAVRPSPQVRRRRSSTR